MNRDDNTLYHVVGILTVAHELADPAYTLCGMFIPEHDAMWFSNADAATATVIPCEGCRQPVPA